MVIISNDIYRCTNEVESNYHTYKIKVISFFLKEQFCKIK